ncbi:protein FAR1-RELATED SEQUENCE 5-like [Aegilops tauschii subsp. strangulata]|uniref:protein FAR1-RELATED SEQUENCE 5-like n=1 Tax=Aegilops tauschii subsp. strangulata TaxID=200361 RepID=UPI003CC8A4DB
MAREDREAWGRLEANAAHEAYMQELRRQHQELVEVEWVIFAGAEGGEVMVLSSDDEVEGGEDSGAEGVEQDERRMKKLRSSQQQVHNPKPTPDLPDYLIPRLKMRFKDVEKAREFYNRYARHAGFGIRKTRGNDNHKYFVCAFQGIHTSSVSEANKKRNKTSQRMGCNARMRVKVQEDDTCVVVDIEYNHNHQLMQTDDMLVFLHSHKNYDPTILEYVKLLQYHDVKHTTIMSMLSENEDGSYFLSMTGRHLLNQKAMNARKDDLDDVLKLVSFFKDMKAINDEFFYDIQVDKDKPMPIDGEAIPQSFPNTVHKLCRWHIMKKYREYLALLYKKYKTFKEEFTAILNWPLMPTEFEDAWAQLVHNYNLENDQMMKLWSDRKMWISAYYKNIFCARMNSTQRSESMNHVLKKGFVKGTQNLHKFARRVNACIQTWMQKENEQTMTNMTNHVTKTTYGYEEDMSIKYTRAVYTEMRNRMRNATLFRAKRTVEPTKYLVYYHNKPGHDDEEIFSWSKHEFQVVADPENEIYECECKLWTHTGLFCLHIMNILDYLKPDKFPNKYILKQYTKTAKSQPTFDTRDYNTTASDGSSRLSKQDILLQLNLMVNKKAMRCDQQYDRAYYVLKRLVEELDAIHSANQVDADERMAEEDAEIEDDLHYYAAEMLNAAAEADQCKQGDGQSMEQR